MKSNELRIGNILMCGEQFVKVNCIFPDHFTCIDFGGFYCGDSFLENFTPILLTEQWLIDFGFEKALNGWWDSTENWSIKNGYFRMGTDEIIKFSYVHHLQNLYFDLAGEELTKII